jgi:hypothetical protein
VIHTLYNVSPHDSVHSPFILFRMNAEGRLAVMEEYGDLVCPKCHKVDERAALTRGILDEVVVRSKRPFVASLDCFFLVDDQGRKVFSEVLPDALDYFPIPSSGFYVATGSEKLQPDPADPGFRFVGGRCAVCRRPREVVWSRIPPTGIPLRSFTCVKMEGIQGGREAWLVSKEIAERLDRASPLLTGLGISSPKQIEVPDSGGEHGSTEDDPK